jgi:hypothetical protein
MKQYLVWCPDLGSTEEDGRKIMAHDPEDAACLWARREDSRSADYWIVGGTDANVVVRDPDGAEHALIVSGESVPSYRARPKVIKEQTP